MQILVLEASTTSAKAMLYSTDEGILDLMTEEYHAHVSDMGNQDAEGVYQQMVQLGKKISAGKKVDGIALSGVWHSVLLCDKDMVPQTKVMSWANSVAADLCEKIRKDQEKVDQFYQTTGCMVNAIYPAFKLKYLKEQGYQLKDYYIVGQGSYNTYRLTGQRIVTDCMASGSGLLDIHTKQYNQGILKELGIDESQLCKLVTYRDWEILSKEGAMDLGLEEGIPVIPPCADGALNQVGVGALEEGIMTFSVGTSAAIRLSTAKPILPKDPNTWCYLSPVMWLSGAATSGACNCIDWIKENCYDASYADIEKASYEVEDTPVFLPFLFGERCPGWKDKNRGAFLGLQPHHTKKDLYQAVQEGILFNIYQCYEVLCELNGVPKKIILSGGILNSEYWTQMCVNIFGCEMEVPTVDQSSLMGAVVLAAEQLGAIKDAKDFKFEQGRIIKPEANKINLYKEKYEIYKFWYDKMK